MAQKQVSKGTLHRHLSGCLCIALESTLILPLFGKSLESSMALLGGSINELQVNLLLRCARGLRKQALAKGDNALPSPDHASLDHNPIFIDGTIVGKTTHGGDRLLGEIEVGGRTLMVVLGTDTIDFKVGLGPVKVTTLACSCDGIANTSRMPRSDTGDLPKSAMGLSWKSGDTPSRYNTFKSVTLGNPNAINHFILIEYGVDIDGALE